MAKVLVTTRMHESIRQKIIDAGYELEFCDATSWQEKLEAARGCVAVACRGGAYPKEFFESLPELKILALPSAGYDNVDTEAAAKLGIYVTNAADGNAKSVAEMAMLLLLGAAKRAMYNIGVMHDGNPWRGRKQPTFTEISGKTIALLGYGNIAREFDFMCKGFGMQVLAYHPRIHEKNLPEGTIACDDLQEALSRADIVSCHIPARKENFHFIGKEEFAKMKQGAIFVNTGRGTVVDEAALIEALQSGHLAGAGLDVFEQEPTPVDNPLLSMDNVFCMPHIGGETAEAKLRVYDIAAQNVLRVLAGEAPISPVNRP